MSDGDGEALDLRQERIGRNQALFREVNERLEGLNMTMSDLIPISDFICECANPECFERIGLTIPEYEALRADPTHFAVRHGHVYLEAERVVAEHTGYTIVEKFEAAAGYAIRSDPRRDRPAADAQ
jgi:hypothetical protein